MSEHRRETRRGQKKDAVRGLMNASAAAEREAAATAGAEEEDIDGFNAELQDLMQKPHTIR